MSVQKRRNTPQKNAILKYLLSVRSHPTAETIHKLIKRSIPKVTLATIYRNLNILVEENKIKRLEVNNNTRFDATTEKHQHCICSKCGSIRDIEIKKISEYALKNIKDNGFEAKNVEILFFGKCVKC